jgi:poly-gamma-glutamate capsule biosynthesis protein CapA/YwtB (metallophosphatase superfamily)
VLRSPSVIFESTISTAESPTQGGDSFAASPRVVPGLRAAGFDLLSLANNHVGDYGDRALRQTLSRFSNSTIDVVGAGRNLAQARRPVIVYAVKRTKVRVPAGSSWGTPVRRGTSVNVVAEPQGFDAKKPYVVVGAHLDTVPVAPGAEDNASGIAVTQQTRFIVCERRERSN